MLSEANLALGRVTVRIALGGRSVCRADHREVFTPSSYFVAPTIATVPAPSTWATLLTGFVGLSFAEYIAKSGA